MPQEKLQELLNQAVTFHNSNDIKNAEIHYAKALELDEENTVAYYNLGLIYRDKNDGESAELFFKKTIELNPSYIESYIQLANLYVRYNLPHLAQEQFEKALEMDASREEIYTNLAKIYFNDYEFEKALKAYNKLHILHPNDATILSNIGSCYQQLNRHEEAKRYYEKALSLDANHIHTLYNLSFIYLLEKDYKIGFDLYRYRYHESIKGNKAGGVAYPPRLLKPEDDVEDKIVYINHEQGLGDTIAFARFYPQFLEKGAKLISYVPPSLIRLFEYNYPEIKFIPPNSDIYFDYNFPMMEAPYLLQTTFEDLPARDGFLKVNPEDTLAFKKRHDFSNKKKIAINFKGSQSLTAMQNRSIDLEDFLEKLSQLKDVEIFSLQYETTPEELSLLEKYGVVNLGVEIQDFYDTSVMIDAMDLVISIDTSVLHLCGALGKESVGLLNFLDVWRWVEDENERVHWCSSISVLQQNALKDWSNVLEELNSHIESRLC